MLIDIGVNLTNRRFDADRDAVIARALAAGVGHQVLTGTSLSASRAALALAKKHPGILTATAGVHPHDAKSFDAATLAALRELTAAPEVVAVGECGLDFNRDFSPRPAQERAFAEQLALACEVGLPVFLHERDAHDRFLAILAEHRDGLVGGVVHCFTGSSEALTAYLDLGMHIGITGWVCDERRGRALRGLVGRIPVDRLMLETDAPFLTPRVTPSGVKLPRRNEPAFLPHVAEAIAECTGRSVGEITEQTTATARAFFALPAASAG
ncbi:MAG: TatD DNase family protein [Myxococcota bacterium]